MIIFIIIAYPDHTKEEALYSRHVLGENHKISILRQGGRNREEGVKIDGTTIVIQRQVGMRNGVMIAILQRKLIYASCSLKDLL